MERRDLDALAVNIDLMVLSITQSIVLGILVAVAVDPIFTLRLEYWPYIVATFATILSFWSRTLLHILSFVTWPPEFGRSFAYFLAAFLEGLAAQQVTHPQGYFVVATIYGAAGWFIYWLDLRFVQRHLPRGESAAGDELLDDIVRDQKDNIRVYMPFFTVLMGTSAVLIGLRPDVFIAGHWHVLPGLLLASAGVAYTFQGLPLLTRRSRLILGKSMHSPVR